MRGGENKSKGEKTLHAPCMVLCHPLPLSGGSTHKHTHCAWLQSQPSAKQDWREPWSQSPTFQESPLVGAAALGDLCAWNQPGRVWLWEPTAGRDRLLDHPHQMQRCRTVGHSAPGPDPRSARTQSHGRLPEAPRTGPQDRRGAEAALPESSGELAF